MLRRFHGRILSVVMLAVVSGSMFAVTIQDGFPKAASTSRGTKGAIVAMLDVPYDKLLPVATDAEQMKYYVHPNALESRLVEDGEHPIAFLKIRIFGPFSRETYLKYTYTLSEDKIILQWENVVWQGKKGSFKENKGRVIFSQIGDKTQVQYVSLIDANLPLISQSTKRSLMLDNLKYYVTHLEKVVLETMEEDN